MKIFALFLLTALLYSGLASSQTRLEGDGVVLDAAPLSGSQSKAYLAEIIDARQRVEKWWGATFADPLRVEVTREGGPSMALVPAWRGEHGKVIFRFPRVRAGNSATVHEIIHVYAPNQNRFLAEGLATYGHGLLGGNSAYPNFGKDIDAMARAALPKFDVLTLEKVSTPTPLGNSEDDEVGAYVIGASLVKFLIEEHGLEKFRELYALTPLTPGKRGGSGSSNRWQDVYGMPLSEIVTGWKAKIGAR
jgi:hypothetical protein